MRATIAIACLLSSGIAASVEIPPPPPPIIELYTMGAGDELFSRFGHAAICVRDARAPMGRCYNYGTADFRTPLPLTWSFVRGRALFWVSVLDLPSMINYYVSVDRSIWRQRLPLTPEQAERLSAALEFSTDERVRYYRYHHFNDNCTTRIRDAIDRATDGALSRDPSGAHDAHASDAHASGRGPSFREYARRGFAGDWPLLMVTELVLGRPADRATDPWTAMFLPDELRARTTERLHAPVELVYKRRAPLELGATWLGDAAFVLAGAVLALIVLAAARVGRRSLRASLALAGFALGLVALVLDALALLSSFPELRANEALLAYWPTDFLLPALPMNRLRQYAALRLIVLFVVGSAHLIGFTQPLAPLALPALPLAAAWLVAIRERRSSRSAAGTPA